MWRSHLTTAPLIPRRTHECGHLLRTRPARGRLHRPAAALAAGPLSTASRPNTRRRPRGRGNNQTKRAAYFELQGNVCALLAAKDHVNLFLYDGAIVPDPEGIITAGHSNKTARTVSFRQGEAINGRALNEMFKQIIANNRAGGWRRLKNAERG